MTIKQYIEKISTEPLPEMIKEGKGYKYIPKSILQHELTTIYNGNVKWEMLRDNVTRNGLWGTGILWVKHPVSGEWLFYTGTASLPHEKRMRLNFPNLESHCMINACKKIGVWFGQTLNLEQDDTMPDEDVEVIDLETNREHERVLMLLDDCKTVEELGAYRSKIPNALLPEYMNRLKILTQKIITP